MFDTWKFIYFSSLITSHAKVKIFICMFCPLITFQYFTEPKKSKKNKKKKHSKPVNKEAEVKFYRS